MKWVRRLAALSAFLVIASAAAGWLWLRASLPLLDGKIPGTGAGDVIEIVRNAHGVPTIYAESESDAYFGLGFVHAQDRLWQMELVRRAGAGRLAELFGPRALARDRYFRTIDFSGVAERNFAHMNDEARELSQAYAAGVNAALASRAGPWPIEISLFGVAPEPWTPVHSILAIKMMAVELAGNARGELLRARLLESLPRSAIETLWPAGDALVPPPPGHARVPAGGLDGAHVLLPRGAPPGVGSNNWAVAAARSASGAPMLANDPHLGLTVPATWYLAHLSAPGLEVVGATIPGIPAVIVGRNRTAAWGVTNTGPDVQDLIAVEDDDVMNVREIEISVRGEAPEIHHIRVTRYGPIVSDVSGVATKSAGDELALAWTALAGDDVTMQAGFDLAKAETVEDLFSALADYHGPQQNFLAADVKGGIGFLAAGRVPVRQGHDGWLPAKPEHGAWIGTIPFAELPQARNPASGVLFTANQRIVPGDYPHFITRDWTDAYRARRIAELLAARERHAVADFMDMQTDVLSLMAVDFLPVLLAAPTAGDARAAHRLLSAWDGRMDPDRSEPLIFQAWYAHLVEQVLADELGAFFDAYHGRRPAAMWRILNHEPAWCDDIATDEEEGCEELISRALPAALVWIGERYGADMAAWRWGAAHKAVSRHSVFSDIPLIGRLFEIAREHGGGPYTVMQANTIIAERDAPFEERHGASLRAIFDLADPDGTRAIIHTGQSGHVLSPHYADLADSWAAGEYITLPLTRAAVEASAAHRLMLTP